MSNFFTFKTLHALNNNISVEIYLWKSCFIIDQFIFLYIKTVLKNTFSQITTHPQIRLSPPIRRKFSERCVKITRYYGFSLIYADQKLVSKRSQTEMKIKFTPRNQKAPH